MAAVAALAACAFLPACKRDEGPADDNRPTTIGVTLLTVQHQFYQDLRAGLEDEAAQHGFKLLITTAEFDPGRQADQIDEFLVQRVDALIVCPCDSRSVGANIAAANDANVPVVTADIASAATLGKVSCHVASDNVEGGRRAAELMAKALSGQGEVAILSHPAVTSVTDRVKGFKEEMARHPDIKIVVELGAEGKRDKAARVMEDVLQSHPDLAGVFGINDDTALGALAAIEAAGKLGAIKIVGYDATPEAREKIKSGAIYGDVIQNPRLIGAKAIEAVKEILEGRTPPAVIPVEVGVFTGES